MVTKQDLKAQFGGAWGFVLFLTLILVGGQLWATSNRDSDWDSDRSSSRTSQKSESERSCSQLLKTHQELAQETVDRLQSKIAGRVGPFLSYAKIAVYDDLGQPVGYLDYFLSEDKKNIEEILVIVTDYYTVITGDVPTLEANRGRGVARYLYARMILDEPQVETVSTRLILDNLQAYESGLHMGLSEADALRLTSHYKIMASLGFSKIQHYEAVRDLNGQMVGVHLVLTRLSR